MTTPERIKGPDTFGAEFTHQGEDCTFKTLVKRFGLSGDPASVELAEIVHDIDLKDDKFNRLEAAGLDAVVSGLAALLKDDRKLLRQAGAVFDGLYALMSGRSRQGRGDGGRRQTKRRAGKRGGETGERRAG